MDSFGLTLRQQKLLHYLQSHTEYVRGSDIASYLKISSRTVRSEVALINRVGEKLGIRVDSLMGRGYFLSNTSRRELTNLEKSKISFMTRKERIIHIAFAVCNAKEPLDLSKLEDEMYVSQTTLSHDIDILRKHYLPQSEAQVHLKRHKNSIFLESDEYGRRALLVFLLTENWDYNGRGDIFFDFPFVDASTVKCVMNINERCLSEAGLLLEDVNMVYLNIMVCMAIFRIKEGYNLTKKPEDRRALALEAKPEDRRALVLEAKLEDRRALALEAKPEDRRALALEAEKVSNRILDEAGERLGCSFSPAERICICNFISTSLLKGNEDENTTNSLGAKSIRAQHLTPGPFLRGQILAYPACDKPSGSISAANLIDIYLTKIRKTFGLDFSKDRDFYNTLLLFFSYLMQRVPHFVMPEMPFSTILHSLRIEFEIAFLFQKLSLKYYDRYLNEKEMLYLAMSISGAIEHYFQRQSRLNTVIMCHMNLPAAWSIKLHLLCHFSGSLDIQGVYPVYMKNRLDFSSTDLILSTAAKIIKEGYESRTILITPLVTEDDLRKIRQFIKNRHMLELTGEQIPNTYDLLAEADWHEDLALQELHSLIRYLSKTEIESGNVAPEYLTDILRREKLLSFINNPSIILMYSLTPAKKTHITAGILRHRIQYNGYKIRTVLMLSLRQDERLFLFKLIFALYSDRFDLDDTRFLKTRESLLTFLRPYC